MNWKAWLQGLAAAAIGGAATGATQSISTSGHINTATGITAGAGALVTVLAYLMKSPIGQAPAADPSAQMMTAAQASAPAPQAPLPPNPPQQ